MGHEVCAWIIPHKDAPSLDDLREFCAGQIAHFKVPKYVRFAEEYPLTVTGKIKKNVMRDITNYMMETGDSEIQVLGHKKIK
jgi:fatty-acyl-CoA synthase